MSGISTRLILSRDVWRSSVREICQCVQLASYLERSPLMWMMFLHLHVSLNADDDDDDDDDDDVDDDDDDDDDDIFRTKKNGDFCCCCNLVN